MSDERDDDIGAAGYDGPDDVDEVRGADDATWRRPAPAPSEGVRILGAEEAQAVIESGHAATRLPSDAPRFGDVPPRPEPPAERDLALRFPLAGEGPTWSASEEGERPAVRPETGAAVPEPSGSETSQPVPLPHWTEPPTGEVLRILPEAEEVDVATGELDPLGGRGVRYRSDASDWDDSGFHEIEAASLKEQTTDFGALAEPVSDLDDDAEFEEAVAARRRVRRVSTRPARPAASAGTEAGVPARAAAGHDDEAGGGPAVPHERDLPVALVTAGVMAAVALGAFALGRSWTAWLAAIVVGLCAFEFYEALRKRGFHPATLLGLIACVAIVPIAFEQGTAAFPLVSVLVVVFTLLWYMVEVVRAREVVSVGVTLLVYCYLGLLGGFAGLLLAARDGIGLIVGLAVCAIAYDVFGYFVGSQFGHRPLSPRISPNKTVEGLIGGMLAAIVFGLLVSLFLSPWKEEGLSHGLLLGLVCAVAAPIGDLCESMLKRDLGIKDFSSLIPGHGGALDRFDAILFCLPAVYYLAIALDLYRLG